MRYRMSLPVELENGSGRMRDISASGVFIETDQPADLRDVIRFSAMLTHAYPATPLQLLGEGPIVRVEGRDNTVGVAVALATVRLQPCEQTFSTH